MGDYKELIADLTVAANRNSNSLNTRDTCRKAADAIEQLAKERDAAVAIVEELSEMAYCHNFQLSDDWVVDFIHKITKIQKKAKKWRGVQNE